MCKYWQNICFGLCLLIFPILANAQSLAVKSNLLYDVTGTINGGVELPLSKKWTLDVSGNYNPFTNSDGKRWKHWLVQPEARYWFCQRMDGHFIGAHALAMKYNVGGLNTDFKLFGTNFASLKDHRYEGWGVGGGVTYGYSWILSQHWNVEAALGVGLVYSKYDRYMCEKCGDKLDSGNHLYAGLTKIAFNLIYVF